jgi:hypothetical protein
MSIPITIKRRGRPRKSNIINLPPIIVDTIEEPIIVETQEEPIVKPVPKVKRVRKVKAEPVAKQDRKVNRWVEHCAEVRSREPNVGKSYREILKIAKLDYQK